ncbi:hypothetical protein BA059_27370 [Mycolicibacterium sp. (ex Dasyatis americana)]|nr:hypothetical protein BA059_27370 [Mycolicibacterium sp. (ex Dasyatis americana)]
MKVPDQDDLAWDLLDAVRTALDIAMINEVSMTMAHGDYPQVIETLLTAAVDGAVPLSGEIRARLGDWVQFYAAHPSAGLLRQLLTDVNPNPDEQTA